MPLTRRRSRKAANDFACSRRTEAAAAVVGPDRMDAKPPMPARLTLWRAQETINCDEADIYGRLMEMTGGRGPDRCIDAVGMEAHAGPCRGWQTRTPRNRCSGAWDVGGCGGSQHLLLALVRHQVDQRQLSVGTESSSHSRSASLLIRDSLSPLLISGRNPAECGHSRQIVRTMGTGRRAHFRPSSVSLGLLSPRNRTTAILIRI
jgi:hypothetical protein